MFFAPFRPICFFGLLLLGMAGQGALPAAAESYHFVTFQFPPLEYAVDDMTPEGIAVDIVRAVMSELGYEVTISIYPWTRALHMAQTGAADAIFTAYRNPERERYLDFSKEVLFPQVVYFYKRRGDSITFAGDIQSMAGLRIGVVSTISYGRIFDQARPALSLDKARTLENTFEKLLRQRVDVVPSNIYVADYTLKKLGLTDRIVRLPHAIERVPSYIAFSKKRHLTALRDQFDAQLAAMKQRSAYDRIVSRYNVHLLQAP